MRTTPERTLTAEPHPSMRKRIYANMVTEQIVASTDHYTVSNLDVNCGAYDTSPFFKPDSGRVTQTDVGVSVPMIHKNILTLTSPDGRREYFTVDLNPIVPAGWTVRVERLNDRKPISFGVVVCRPGYENLTDGVHRLTNADLRGRDDTQCESKAYGFHVFGTTVQCERRQSHLGHHQAFKDDFHYDWDKPDNPNATPYGEFGFRNECLHCGFVLAGGPVGRKICRVCTYWLSQSHAEGFVIDGKHYRRVEADSDPSVIGRRVKVRRHDGTDWTGELHPEGHPIPPRFRALFPDNAHFV